MQSLSRFFGNFMTENTMGERRIVPQAAVSAAIFRAGRILLVQRSRPPAANLWSLPGGHIEPGEAAIDALTRELYEETAIRAKISGICGVRDVVQQNDRGAVLFHRVIVVFCGVWTEGAAVAGSDAAAVRWETLAHLGDLPVTEGLSELASQAWKMVNDGTG
ncbi:MAG: NUDIX hydrolase [Rhodomicrobiaceae bacterium]